MFIQEKVVQPRNVRLTNKKYRFNQKNKFNQEEIQVQPRDRSLVKKKYKFSEEIKVS